MQNRTWLLPVTIHRLARWLANPGKKDAQNQCALTCDYLTALVILAAAPVVKAAVLPSPALPASPASHA